MALAVAVWIGTYIDARASTDGGMSSNNRHARAGQNRNEHYNVISVLYYSLQEAETRV